MTRVMRVNTSSKRKSVKGPSAKSGKRAHHVWSDRVIAVKIPTDPQYPARASANSMPSAGLQHPNIVRARRFRPIRRSPYLAMEYVPGTSLLLRPLIEQNSRRKRESAILKQVLLKRSQFAHKNGVIYPQAMKPENVLIDNGVAKLTDFGLGKSFVAEGGANSIVYLYARNSAAGGVVGTMAYMSPCLSESRVAGRCTGGYLRVRRNALRTAHRRAAPAGCGSALRSANQD